MDTDLLLIRKMKRGDTDAVEEFVRKYYPKILQYCGIRMGPSYAEDLTQEVFEKFFRTFGQYRHYGKALNYLYVIAGNVCRDYHRKERGIVWEELSAEAAGSFRTGGAAEAAEQRCDIERALKQMPLRVREVAILFFFQELKQAEVARILGISLPLVKYRIGKAREWLTAYFEEGSYETVGRRNQSV